MVAGKHKMILVIDDDQDLLDLVALMLESVGYRVETAINGLAGLQAVQHAKPDLILLDIKMPVISGQEFAREFYAHYDSSTPIVVITASESAQQRAKEIGASGWIGKPFDLDVLINTVGRYIGAP